MNENDSFSHNDPIFADSPMPQPIPRAGLGMVPEIGASKVGSPSLQTDGAHNDMENHAVHAESTSARHGEDELGEMDDELMDAIDPATIPELAPLITSRSLDELHLDEFDIEAERSRNGQYSNGGGGDDGGDYNGSENDDGSSGDFSADLFSHLAELRARILYSVMAVLVASAVTWNYGKAIQQFLARPIIRTLKASGMADSKLVTLDPMEGFYLYFQITLTAAILLAAPFILFQMWRFIEPALTKTERRYTIFLVPFSVILFFAGVTLGYILSPLFFQFFIAFQPAESVATFSYGKSVALLAKMLLVFGVCFQVPVVTIFLNKIGVVSRNVLIEYWRHAVVIIFTIVAIITPTWDPLTLTACALPPCLLYILSIWLVKWL